MTRAEALAWLETDAHIEPFSKYHGIPSVGWRMYLNLIEQELKVGMVSRDFERFVRCVSAYARLMEKP